MYRRQLTGLALLVGACASPVGVDVTYWQDEACSVLEVGDEPDRTGWVWCVPSVTVRESGEMELAVRWTGIGLFGHSVDKGSDTGNRNMYLTDDIGNRYDHIETTGAAADGVRLDTSYPSATGAFVFPPAHPGATRFAFHDDDQHIAIENVTLDAASATDPRTSASVFGAIARANRITITNGWQGLDDGYVYTYHLTREGAYFVVDREEWHLGPRTNWERVNIPEETIDELVRQLIQSPALTRDYVPTSMYMNNRPFTSIEFEVYGSAIEFSSRSEGPGMVPWKATTFEKSYVVPDATPARALALLEPFLPGFRVSVPKDRLESPAGAR